MTLSVCLFDMLLLFLKYDVLLLVSVWHVHMPRSFSLSSHKKESIVQQLSLVHNSQYILTL
jgi:hypothetical protein